MNGVFLLSKHLDIDVLCGYNYLVNVGSVPKKENSEELWLVYNLTTYTRFTPTA